MTLLILIIITTVILTILAGVFNAKMDYIVHNGLDSESWLNKWYLIYKFGLDERIKGYKHWYYFGLYKPKYRERFPFSSTILVFMTDYWHLYKWCMFLCLELSYAIITIEKFDISWWYLLPIVFALKAVRGIGFTLIYDKK